MASKEAYITGVGQSEVGVRLTRHPLLLTIDAVKEALADAGLTVDQIDGVSTYPGKMSGQPGFSPVGSEELADALGHQVQVAYRRRRTARAACRDRQCRHGGQARARPPHHLLPHGLRGGGAGPARRISAVARGGDVPGSMQYLMPYWAMSASNWVAQYANRHVFKYGMKREQLGQIAINAHRNARSSTRARATSPRRS